MITNNNKRLLALDILRGLTIIFMIIGSLPFLVIAQTSFNNIFATIKDHQVKIFLLILKHLLVEEIFLN